MLGRLGAILAGLGCFLGPLEPILVSPYSPSGLVTKPAAKPIPSQDSPKPYLNSLHFSFRFLLRLGSLLGSSWLPLGLHLGSLLGSILAQLRPKSPLDTLLFQKREFSRNLKFSNEKSPKMTPRRHPRRPKIDPRRLQDDLQELLFSTSFSTSILVPLGSKFGLILAPFWLPKSAQVRVGSRPCWV